MCSRKNYVRRKGSVGSCLYPFLQANIRIFENNVRWNFWLAGAFWSNVLDLPDYVYLEV